MITSTRFFERAAISTMWHWEAIVDTDVIRQHISTIYINTNKLYSIYPSISGTSATLIAVWDNAHALSEYNSDPVLVEYWVRSGEYNAANGITVGNEVIF